MAAGPIAAGDVVRDWTWVPLPMLVCSAALNGKAEGCVRRYHQWISLVALGAILLGVNASAAVTSDIPSAKFNADDRRMQREAQDLVLASSDAGSKQDWQNPATGNSGKIEL